MPGAVFVGNAFGKLAGSTQVEELGTIETPIVLTNTLSVGTAVDAVVRWTLAQPGNEQRAIGERARRRDERRRPERHPRPARHARARAVGDRRREERAPSTKARSAPAPARSRSAGRAASAPRRAACASAHDTYTVGVLVQTNYGGKLDDRRRAGVEGTDAARASASLADATASAEARSARRTAAA